MQRFYRNPCQIASRQAVRWERFIHLRQEKALRLDEFINAGIENWNRILK